MPYFAWKGVTLEARIKKGINFAKDVRELDAFLFKKNIALLSCSPKKIWLKKRPSCQMRIDYIMQLAMLIRAGILVPQALRLVADQTEQITFAETAQAIADEVEQGISLSDAMRKQSAIFAPFMVQMVTVGQESGSLPEALQVLSHHLETMASFKARLRSALLLPLVTFIFFLAIIAVMLIVIVPQFASIFSSMQKELPGATQAMITMSAFLQSRKFVVFLGGLGCAGILLIKYCRSLAGKKRLDTLLLSIPGINGLIISKNMAGFFHANAMLLRGGMPLASAVRIAKESIENTVIKQALSHKEQEIRAGTQFADAMAGCPEYCRQDMISLLRVGQESGQLGSMLERVACIYQQRLLQNLSRINALFQPFLLIMLGLMITGLILGLYSPIMSMSYAV
jgi:type II secretory pathway component PulF